MNKLVNKKVLIDLLPIFISLFYGKYRLFEDKDEEKYHYYGNLINIEIWIYFIW